MDSLHGRNHFNELVQFAGEKVPAFANMAGEFQGFVLGEDEDAADIGIDAVGKGEIDDAVCAAKGTAGFAVCSVSGARRSPAPPASRIARTFCIRLSEGGL